MKNRFEKAGSRIIKDSALPASKRIIDGYRLPVDTISFSHNKNVLFILNFALIILAIVLFDITFGGKKIPTYLCVYLLGYYLFSKQDFIEKLVGLKWLFTVAFLLSSVMNVILFVYIEDYELLNNICNYISFATGIPALICLGKTYLDYTNMVSRYCSKLSYMFYIVHFPIVVLCQYFISITGVGSICNFVLSLVISTIVTGVVCCFINILPLCIFDSCQIHYNRDVSALSFLFSTDKNFQLTKTLLYTH